MRITILIDKSRNTFWLNFACKTYIVQKLYKFHAAACQLQQPSFCKKLSCESINSNRLHLISPIPGDGIVTLPRDKR